MSFVGYALVNGHIGKAPPLCGTILTLLQIAEVVHVLVCLYLKGIQPVARVGVLLAGVVSLEVVAQVETVEAPPGVPVLMACFRYIISWFFSSSKRRFMWSASCCECVRMVPKNVSAS